ncbi:hypothetical protein CRUP_013841, partial [Coryphaenoides rupestris]
SLSRVKRDWIIPPIRVLENSKQVPEDLVQSDKIFTSQVIYKLEGPASTRSPRICSKSTTSPESIRSKRPLDREKHKSFTLKAFALSPSGERLENPTTIEIMVLDQNDNRPSFIQNQFTGSVAEFSVPGTAQQPGYRLTGTSVMSVSAIDADDPLTDNAILSYSIVGQESEPRNAVTTVMFGINNETGAIYTRDVGFDREVVKSFRLKLQVADMSGMGLASEGVAIIHVTDINNHAPQFNPSMYQVSGLENRRDYELCRVNVTDRDDPGTGNWEARYAIARSDASGHFAVHTDPATNQGVVTVVKPLDFESQSEHTLVLTVANRNPLSPKAPRVPVSSATVVVTVVNENEAPRFKEDPIHVLVPESVVNVTVCTCDSFYFCRSETAAILGSSVGISVLALIIVMAAVALLLLLLLLAVAINGCTSRRRHLQKESALLAESEEDVRDNVLNYDEQGGGEEDENAYNLDLLSPAMLLPTSPPPSSVAPRGRRGRLEGNSRSGRTLRTTSPSPTYPRRPPADPTDIEDYINEVSELSALTVMGLEAADRDPNVPPYDTALIYDYEGEGSLAGSLSSIASGSSDGDQDYDYLNDWGPRFKKLASILVLEFLEPGGGVLGPTSAGSGSSSVSLRLGGARGSSPVSCLSSSASIQLWGAMVLLGPWGGGPSRASMSSPWLKGLRPTAPCCSPSGKDIWPTLAHIPYCFTMDVPVVTLLKVMASETRPPSAIHIFSNSSSWLNKYWSRGRIWANPSAALPIAADRPDLPPAMTRSTAYSKLNVPIDLWPSRAACNAASLQMLAMTENHRRHDEVWKEVSKQRCFLHTGVTIHVLPVSPLTYLQCGEVNEDVSVQTARSHQSVVQDVGSVGGRQDDH